MTDVTGPKLKTKTALHTKTKPIPRTIKARRQEPPKINRRTNSRARESGDWWRKSLGSTTMENIKAAGFFAAKMAAMGHRTEFQPREPSKKSVRPSRWRETEYNRANIPA